MNPICGPSSSSGIASENVLPVLHARHAALHRGRVDEVERAQLVVVAPAAPVADPRGNFHEVVVERHRCPPEVGQRSEREAEHADGVAPGDLVDGLVVEVGDLLLEQLAGVRPRRVGVRVVGLERHVVDPDRDAATRGRDGRGRSTRRSAGGSSATAAPSSRPARHPTRGARPTRRRHVRGCRGSTRSDPRCTRA